MGANVLWSIICHYLLYLACMCSLMESFVLHVLQRPTSTAFRMFPPLDLCPACPIREAHLASLACLACVPYLANYERQAVYVGPVGRLIQPLTRSHIYVAYALMTARIWLAIATWNVAVAQFRTAGNIVSISLKGGALTFLL